MTKRLVEMLELLSDIKSLKANFSGDELDTMLEILFTSYLNTFPKEQC